MTLFFEIVRLLVGGALLYFGAEWLVKGAAGLAAAFRIRPMVIGMTVVAFGTSSPELAVGIAASIDGSSDIALGNVLGSNIANIGLILGVTALISPPQVEASLLRREIPVLMATALLPIGVLYDGVISRTEGLAMIAGAVAFTWWMLRAKAGISTQSAASAESDAEAIGAPTGENKLWLLAVAVVGLAILVGGGKLFVTGAVGLARMVGMSDRLVGLTIVAIGTSLPELAASLVAALRGHSAIAVGNVIGSNIFNVLLVLGGAAAARPLQASLRAVRFDLATLVGLTLLCSVIVRTQRTMTRAEGALLAGGYGAFLLALAMWP